MAFVVCIAFGNFIRWWFLKTQCSHNWRGFTLWFPSKSCLLRISKPFPLMWPRHKCHRELSNETLDTWLLDYETTKENLVIVDPWKRYKFPCLVPYITTNFPFPLIYITPPSTQQENLSNPRHPQIQSKGDKLQLRF